MATKVMVVDDSMVIRAQATAALGHAGFDVIQACDGQEALERLVETPDLALIVCDVNMPRVNGIQFLEAMAQGERRVPTVMLTTEGKQALITRAKELGAKGWIIKPFKEAMLVAAVRKLTAAAA